MRALLLALMTMAMMAPALGERLVSTVSSDNVQITSSFEGTVLSLFGNIEPDAGATINPAGGPYNVIIVVTGPLQNRVARLKTNTLGIWTNTDQVVFRAFPSYYKVISSARLTTVTDPETLLRLAVLPEEQARRAVDANTLHAERFGQELVRLMSEDFHFGVNEGGVTFLSGTAYRAQISLPSDVANGPFLAHTMVFKNQTMVAERTEGFSVRKTGFERFIGVAARQYPLPYGLVCVLLALGTGWLGGVVFRR